jgi:hypothetical protein
MLALEMRIGIHTGAVVSAIGTQQFTFDIWGEAVNKASFTETIVRPTGSMSRKPWRNTSAISSSWNLATTAIASVVREP